VENNRRLLEGWGEDGTSCHYQTCMLALLSVAEINVHVIKKPRIWFCNCDGCMSCLCAVQFLS
jgi:hypothetical protein